MTELSAVETRQALRTHPGLGAWRAFLLAHSMITRRLDDELRAGQGLSLAEYDALVQLAESPAHRLRMSQLAERVLLSRSGVTRLVDRLEAGALVRRESCPSDARGAEAVLTDAGRDRLREATSTHLRGVARYFLTSMPPTELEELERSLAAVVGRMASDADGQGSPDGPPDDTAAGGVSAAGQAGTASNAHGSGEPGRC